MAKIRLDDGALKKDSKNLSNRIIEFDELSNRLGGLLNDISSSWTGEASDAYVAKMYKQLEKVKKMRNVTETYKGYVDKALSDMLDLDEKLSEKINGSF